MGVECAVYQINYAEPPLVHLNWPLSVLGWSDPQTGTAPKFALVNEDRYWIDIQVAEANDFVTVRIALYNPVAAFSMLRTVLTVCTAASPSSMVDLGTGKSYDELSEGSWAEISQDLERRQATFGNQFGDLVAAISADDVFERLRDE